MNCNAHKCRGLVSKTLELFSVMDITNDAPSILLGSKTSYRYDISHSVNRTDATPVTCDARCTTKRYGCGLLVMTIAAKPQGCVENFAVPFGFLFLCFTVICIQS